MTDHTDHASARRRLTNDETDELARTHLATCTLCQKWAAHLELTLALAPTLYEPPSDTAAFTEAVVSRARSKFSRQRIFAVVAPAVAVAAAVVGFLIVAPSNETSRLSNIATTYENTGSVRFVFETSASVAISEVAVDAPGAGAALTVLPQCEAPDPSEDSLSDIDLEAALDALTGARPCDALNRIRRDVGNAVTTASATLSLRAAELEERLERLDVQVPASPLEQASLTSLRAVATSDLQAVEESARRLERANAAAAASLQTVADAASTGLPTSDYAKVAGSDLRALVRLVDDTTSSTPASPTAVSWTQVATGTWHPDHVEISGETSNTNDRSQIVYQALDEDPLQLAPILFKNPNTLIELLRSAPDTPGDVVTWSVSRDMISYPGADDWHATANFVNGTLDRLSLSTSTSSGIRIDVTFTPAR